MSELLGRQRPTIRCVPEYVSSAGAEAIKLAHLAGLDLDPWQQDLVTDGMGERADGSWAAFEVAVLLARQNGKTTGPFAARILAGLYVLAERLLIYTAHEFKTAQEMFRLIEDLISGTPVLSKRVRAVSRSKGDEGIELTTGQRLRFLARSTGSGRGFSGTTIFLDEAQILGEGPVDALMPTMSAQPNPQLWYAASAPDRDIAPCEQITRVRNRARSGQAAGLTYYEWSADLCSQACPADCPDHDDPNDPLTWAKTNPGLGVRISVEHVHRERESMSHYGFCRERLSVGNYPTIEGGWEVISEAAWLATAHARVTDADGNVLDPGSQALDPVAFAIEVAPDRTAAAIAVAGRRLDGLLHIEVVDHRPGTSWVAPRLGVLIARWRPAAVALAPAGPAGSLDQDLAEALEGTGVELTRVTGRDTTAACGALYDAVVRPREAPEDWAPTLRHVPHPALSAALAGAARRYLGDAWVWDRRGSSVDPSPLIAVTLARHAFLTRPQVIELEGALMA